MHPHDERPYSFCPLCGADLELRTLKPTEPERLVCIAVRLHLLSGSEGRRRHDHPRRPRTTSCWSRRAIEPGYGKWVFPGGFVDRGEEVLDGRGPRGTRGSRTRHPHRPAAERLFVSRARTGDHRLRRDDDRRRRSPAMTRASKRRVFAPDDHPVGRTGVPEHDRSALREFLQAS